MKEYTTAREAESWMHRNKGAAVFLGFLTIAISEVIVVQIDYSQALILVRRADDMSWPFIAYQTETGALYMFIDHSAARFWVMHQERIRA